MAKKKKRTKLWKGRSTPSGGEAPSGEIDLEAPPSGAEPGPTKPGASEDRQARMAHLRMLADVATSLWYLKTKHFKVAWDAEDPELDDPRERRAVGRMNKGIQALRDGGIEVRDPTGSRYPPGRHASRAHRRCTEHPCRTPTRRRWSQCSSQR